MKRLFFALLVILFAAMPCRAATYYIDYASGADGNNGAAKATPLKHHPYMTGWTGSYSHSAGDRFIFKGGVTWPNACFPLTVQAGGASGTPDYYGVDATWYTGSPSGTVNTAGTTVTLQTGTPFDPKSSDWAGGSITINGTAHTIASVESSATLTLTGGAGVQTGVNYSASLFPLPTFDAQSACIGGSTAPCGGTFIDLSGNNYITIDRIRFTNYYWQGAVANIFYHAFMIKTTASLGFTFENSIIDNWSHDTFTHCGGVPASCDAAGAVYLGASSGWLISHDTFTQCYNSCNLRRQPRGRCRCGRDAGDYRREHLF